MYLWNGGWIDFSPLWDVWSGCIYEKLSKHCRSSLNLHFCLYRSSVRLTSNTLSRLLSILSVVSLSVTRERADSVPNLSVVAPWSHRSAPWMQFNTIGTLSSTRASPVLRHIRSPHRSRDWFDSFWCSCKHHKMPFAWLKIVLHKTMVKLKKKKWSKKVQKVF